MDRFWSRWEKEIWVMLVAWIFFLINCWAHNPILGVIATVICVPAIIYRLAKAELFGPDIWQRILIGMILIGGFYVVLLDTFFLLTGEISVFVPVVTLGLVFVVTLFIPAKGKVAHFIFHRHDPILFTLIAFLAS